MGLWDKIKAAVSVEPVEMPVSAPDLVENTPVHTPNIPPAPKVELLEFEFDEPRPDLDEVPEKINSTPEVGVVDPVSGVTDPPKRGRGRPKGSTNKYKGLLTDEQRERLRNRDNRAEKKAKADAEKERRSIMKAEASAQALALPIPEPLVLPAKASEEKAYVREAIVKVIALARETGDKTRLEALLDRAYMLAMDESTELKELLKVIELVAERMEPKPGKSDDGVGVGGTPNLTININATRFQAKPTTDGGVIDVSN